MRHTANKPLPPQQPALILSAEELKKLQAKTAVPPVTHHDELALEQAPQTEEGIQVAQAQATAAGTATDTGSAGLAGAEAGSGAAAGSAGGAAGGAGAATAAGGTAAAGATAAGAAAGGLSLTTIGLAAAGVGAVAMVASAGKKSDAPPSGPASVTGTAAELAPGGSKYGQIAAGSTVTITDAATLAQLAAIDAANGNGALNYTGVSDTAGNLVANTGGYVQADKNVTVKDAATLAQLAAIDTANGNGALNYTGVSDTAGNLATDAATNGGAGTYVTSGKNVTVTDVATLAQYNAIDAANGSGTLTANAGIRDHVSNLDGASLPTGVGITVYGTLAELTGATNLTGTNRKVEIDDPNASYTVTTLNATIQTGGAFAGASSVKLLQGNLQGTVAELLPGGAVSALIGPAVNLTITDAASIAQLTTLDNATTGTLSYTAITDSVGNLTATGAAAYLNGGNNAAALATVTVTGTASIAQLDSIHNTAGAASLVVNAISDTAANLVNGTTVNAYVSGSVAVTVTDGISLVNLNLIDAATTGTLTFSTLRDTFANLDADRLAGASKRMTATTTLEIDDAGATFTVAQLNALDAAAGTVIVVAGTLQDTAANLSGATGLSRIGAGATVVVDESSTFGTVAQLQAIQTKVNTVGGGASLSYTTVQDTAANLYSGSAAAAVVKTGTTVIVTDAISLAALQALDAANGTAVVQYTAISDTAANIVAQASSSYLTNATTVTVTDAITMAQLAQLNLNNLNLAGGITDTAANLLANQNLIPAGAAITVTDGISLAYAARLDAANGSGAVTYNIVRDTFANLNAQSSLGSKAVEIDDAGTTLTAENITTIDGKTTGTVKVVAGTVSDTAANLFAKVANIGAGANVDVTAEATIAQLSALDAANGAGTLTFTDITDSAANLTATAATSYLNQAAGIVTVTGTPTVTDLGTIATNAPSATLAFTAVSGTAAELAAFSFPGTNVNVTVTDAASIIELTIIDSANGAGTLTYTAIKDSALNLVNAGSVVSLYPVIDKTVTITDNIAISDYNALESANGTAKVNLQAGTGTADTLFIDTTATAFNLANFNGANEPTLTGYEVFDMTGNGNNTLTLTLADLFAVGSNLTDAGRMTFVINGDAGDTVNKGTGWTLSGTADSFNADGSAGSGYSKYIGQDASNHLLELLIQTGVTVV